MEHHELRRRISLLYLVAGDVFYQTKDGSEVWTMSKKKFKNKKNDEWEYEETPEVIAALAKLHEDIRKRQLKEQDDTLNYDTSGK